MDNLRKFIYVILASIRWALPGPLKAYLKNYAELKFQKGFVKTFVENKHLFEEHFRSYRYYDEMRGTLGIGPGTKVLDVGCGISTVLHFVKGELYGIDPLADEYRQIYSYPNGIRVQKALSEHIPFDEGFFDVAFCTNVLDHVENPARTLLEIYRVLKPRGYFVLTVEVFQRKVSRDPAHPHVFKAEDIHELISSNFEVLSEKTSPMMLLEKDAGGKMTLVESKEHTKELVLLLKKR